MAETAYPVSYYNTRYAPTRTTKKQPETPEISQNLTRVPKAARKRIRHEVRKSEDNPGTPLWVVHGTVDKWSGIDISNGRFKSSSSLPVGSPSNDGRLASNGGGTIQGDFYGNGSVVAGEVKTDNVIGTFKADKR